MIRKVLIFACLLLFSSQAFSKSCEELSNSQRHGKFNKEVKLLGYCMIYEGANLIEQGETDQDNVINESFSECRVDYYVARQVLVDKGCSKKDAKDKVMETIAPNVSGIYSAAQSLAKVYNKPDTEIVRLMKSWLFQK